MADDAHKFVNVVAGLECPEDLDGTGYFVLGQHTFDAASVFFGAGIKG